MPPKVRFGKEEILEAAFNLTRKEGLENLTARKIAKAANSSTAPVYSSFNSVEEVKVEVLKRVKKILYSYTFEKYTENNFLNVGVGIVSFAKEEANLFKAIFVNSKLSNIIFEEMKQELSLEMEKDEIYSLLEKEEAREIFDGMMIYTYGFASLINTGFLKHSRDEIIENLRSVGVALRKNISKKK